MSYFSVIYMYNFCHFQSLPWSVFWFFFSPCSTTAEPTPSPLSTSLSKGMCSPIYMYSCGKYSVQFIGVACLENIVNNLSIKTMIKSTYSLWLQLGGKWWGIVVSQYKEGKKYTIIIYMCGKKANNISAQSLRHKLSTVFGQSYEKNKVASFAANGVNIQYMYTQLWVPNALHLI